MSERKGKDIEYIEYLGIDEVIELHRKLIERFGGKDGVRDYGLLESSLFRPQSGYYKSTSLQAAALMQSFAMNHCFLDGNKRVALAATVIFLKLNDLSINVPKKKFAELIINQVIVNNASVEEIATWLENHLI